MAHDELLWQADELARYLCRVGSGDEVDVDLALEQKYGVDLAQFTALIGDLVPLATQGVSALGRKHYRGFAVHGRFVVKQFDEPAAVASDDRGLR